jgi:hypothetical protein
MVNEGGLLGRGEFDKGRGAIDTGRLSTCSKRSSFVVSSTRR